MQSMCTCSRKLKLDTGQDLPLTEKLELCALCRYSSQLPNLRGLPEMLFSENLLRLDHFSGLAIEFNPLDALKMVEDTQDPLRVAVADGWQSARGDFPAAKSIIKPFDWTFTTDYTGSLISSSRKSRQNLDRTSDSKLQEQETSSDKDCVSCTPELSFTVEETSERIDINRLKVREEILFYDDLTLYEDELADHGHAQYSVKVRVMPSSFFILARFYLRIDGALVRINDTRVYHELNRRYLLREYTNRESKLENLNLPMATILNPNELAGHLPLVRSRYEKLIMPRLR